MDGWMEGGKGREKRGEARAARDGRHSFHLVVYGEKGDRTRGRDAEGDREEEEEEEGGINERP